MNDAWVLETVRWRDGAVRILDQTRLPAEEFYLDLRTEEALIDAIRRLAVRGAPAIGVAGAYGLALAARSIAERDPRRFLDALAGAAGRIGAARPTAVNLRWACDRIVRRVHLEAAGGAAAVASGPAPIAGGSASTSAPSASVEALRQAVEREAEAIFQEDLALSRAMARHGFELVPDEGRVVTHCNTGGLATAGGGTALGVILAAAAAGKRPFVHVDETRPLLQGARLTAWELRRAGIPYAVQCDGAAAWLMRTKVVDGVFVGADRIAANGDTANKVGTLALALAAREFGVPFWVVAPRSSFDLSMPDGEAIPIEERGAEEVVGWGGHATAPEGSAVYNPAFDVTPAAWVAGWVTERGIERPPFGP